MARTATKIFTTLAAAAVISVATPAVVQAQAGDQGLVPVAHVVSSIDTDSIAQAQAVVDEQVEAQAVQAATHTDTQAPAQPSGEQSPSVSGGAFVISSSCVGGQDAVDTCLGATYYAPVADYLGVPYYAQHNGMGGEAWLSLKVGDTVIVDGTTYHVAAIRTVATGGDVEQIAGMAADAYLQTCLDDAVHSNVYALTR